jgi:hypothetical protein
MIVLVEVRVFILHGYSSLYFTSRLCRLILMDGVVPCTCMFPRVSLFIVLKKTPWLNPTKESLDSHKDAEDTEITY